MKYCHKALSSTSLAERCQRLDEDLAETGRKHGCRCGGTLHVSNFPRKCVAIVVAMAAIVGIRFSFCCARCRKRTTPPSVRYLGRRQYWGVLVVLLSAAHSGAADRHLILVAHQLGISVSEATLSRWVSWWRNDFVRGDLWRIQRGRFVPAVALEGLPGCLLERFCATDSEAGMLSLLEFLSPLTTASCELIRRRSSMAV